MKKKIKKILARTISKFYHQRGARIFYFHSINPSKENSNSPEAFSRMMRSILEMGKITLTVTDLTQKLHQKEITEDILAITLDDGYLDCYKYAFPVFLDLGIPATFYVIAGIIDGSGIKPRQPLYEGLKMMNKSHILELSNAGMEIGSHTWSHYPLKHADKKTIRYELETSKKYLEDLLGKRVSSFCYPNGEIPEKISDIELFDIFEEIGYTSVTTCRWGCITNQSQPFRLNRQIIEGFDTPEEFIKKIKGNYDYLRILQKIKGL